MRILLSRREFLRHALSAGALASLSSTSLFRLESWADGQGPPVVWLEGAGCSGCLVSLANYFDPVSNDGFGQILSKVDLRYAPLFLTASGDAALSQLVEFMNGPSKQIVLLVSGSIPNRDGFCSVGSFQGEELGFKRALVGLARKALRVAGIGSCACYGGVAGTRTNEPRFAPLEHYLPPSVPSVFVPGCPAHPDWIVTVLANLISGEPVAVDRYRRPLSLFGRTVCSQCPRLPQKEAGQFAQDPYDPALCLKTVGCRGELSFCDAPSRGWNGTGNGCVTGDSICIGCTEPFFPEMPFVAASPQERSRKISSEQPKRENGPFSRMGRNP
jgi:hydrogenase small subunit